jgi:N6-L-threonylcarbamoyladenine synthase
MDKQQKDKTQNKLFLSIETSCDETSIAILSQKVDIDKDCVNPNTILNSFEVISDVVSSQIEIHAKYGGVIPEIGARSHASQIHFLFHFVIRKAVNSSINFIDQIGTNTSSTLTKEHREIIKKLDSIFVTTDPGLASSLRVGQEFAKTLQDYIFRAFSIFVPIIDVNHLKGHVASSFYTQYPHFDIHKIDSKNIYPHIHLLVSGGNTQLILLKSIKEFEIIGQTLDDAAGESFDKIGRMIGLPYPGGVYLSKIAGLIEENILKFPISMLKNNDYNFSYSGLKTHVRRLVESSQIEDFEFEKPLSDQEIEILINSDLSQLQEMPKLQFIKSICISAQFVIVAQLFAKLNKAVKDLKPVSVGISGGVSANSMLKSKIKYLASKNNVDYYEPHLKLTGDNAIMIALAGIVQEYTL